MENKLKKCIFVCINIIKPYEIYLFIAILISNNISYSQIIINEILANPSGSADANCDGNFSAVDDEFVEFFNMGSSSVDLTNYTLSDAAITRHVFPTGTILAANSFIVVYGGGNALCPGVFGQAASSGSLGLSNGGDTVTLKDSSGIIIAQHTYGSSTSGISITRDPDFTGPFVLHSTISGAYNFSPGYKSDGTLLAITSTQIKGFLIFPNPVINGVLNIKTSQNLIKNVKIFDVLGKLVIENVALSTTSINVSNLKAGIYILKVEESKNISVTKFFIK